MADRTSEILAGLLLLPGVRIFQGVRHATADLPLVAHAVHAGRSLVLVESVTWPPGRYAVMANGQIHCDGVYIGQSAGPLMATAQHWQVVLPRGHRVRAVVIVYPAAQGSMSLPEHSARGPAWALADDALSHIRAHLPSGRIAVSSRAVLALAAATMTERSEPCHGDDQDPATATASPRARTDYLALRQSTAPLDQPLPIDSAFQQGNRV